MPLQLTFHLELDSVIITTVWVEQENRLRVTRIEGGGRIIEQLKAHADQAGLVPKSIWGSDIDKESEASWLVLGGYDTVQDELKSQADEAFSELFDHLDVEESPAGGINRHWSDVGLYLRKADGTHTNAWVWKDHLVWSQRRIIP